ncbi:hypothetical protein DFH09DRAFT_1073637 [Mycena vulgaris]|nr:hypothetical protein DFH09DRAFT_1073637 [Mycena vulgaris]
MPWLMNNSATTEKRPAASVTARAALEDKQQPTAPKKTNAAWETVMDNGSDVFEAAISKSTRPGNEDRPRQHKNDTLCEESDDDFDLVELDKPATLETTTAPSKKKTKKATAPAPSAPKVTVIEIDDESDDKLPQKEKRGPKNASREHFDLPIAVEHNKVLAVLNDANVGGGNSKWGPVKYIGWGAAEANIWGGKKVGALWLFTRAGFEQEHHGLWGCAVQRSATGLVARAMKKKIDVGMKMVETAGVSTTGELSGHAEKFRQGQQAPIASRHVVIRTAVLQCEMMMGLYQMVSSLERVAVEKQNIEILVQIGAGRETECVNPPSRGFHGGFNIDKSWSYGDGVASRFRQDSLTDQQDLGCGLIGSCFRARTRPNMNESSHVLSVSVLYPAGARWLSLRGQSARIQASLRAYPGGFPWVEPVSCKVQTVGGIQDVWGMCAKSRGIEFLRMLVALELYEIPREEVPGGAAGVVRGGFPRGGAQRVRFPEEYPNADSCSPNRVIVSCQVRHSRDGARGHTQSVWDPHNHRSNAAWRMRWRFWKSGTLGSKQSTGLQCRLLGSFLTEDLCDFSAWIAAGMLVDLACELHAVDGLLVLWKAVFERCTGKCMAAEMWAALGCYILGEDFSHSGSGPSDRSGTNRNTSEHFRTSDIYVTTLY